MGFVQATMLAALAAVVLPIIAHLVFRRRARPVDLGTLRFLKVAVRQDTRRRRLKRWILLALRIGCVMLLALLFARPYRAEFTGVGSAGMTVVLIDRSASMARLRDGKRIVDRAVGELPQVMATVPSRSRVEVAWFDMKPEPVGADEDDRVSLSGLQAPATLTGGTNFAAALNWAAARCAAARGGGPLAVHVLTDLQRSGFGSLEDLAFPKDIPVRIWEVGPASVANVAVTEVRPVSLMVRAEQPTTIQATLLNTRAESFEQRRVRLRLANKDRVLEIPSVASAAAGASATVTFETSPLSPGLWQGTVSVAGEDELGVDDSRHVALYAAARPRVLLLDGASREVAALGEAYFLEAALRLASPGETAPDGPFRVLVFPYTADARLPDLGQVDVLVVANVGQFATSDAEKVRSFLARGGSAVVFGGGNLGTGSEASYTAAGLSVGKITGNHAARDVSFRIADFLEDHPVLQPFADPQHGDLHRLLFSGCTRIEPVGDVRVLARFADHTPLLVERQNGASRVTWCTVSVGREHGTWSRSRLFLPLVHQLVRGAAGLAGAGPVRERPAAGTSPGVWQVEGGWEVRNLEPSESELESCTPEEFAARMGVSLAAAAEVTTSPKQGTNGTELRSGELWPWLWMLLVVCWIGEGLLANRTVA